MRAAARAARSRLTEGAHPPQLGESINMVFNTGVFAMLASMFTPARAALVFSRDAPSSMGGRGGGAADQGGEAFLAPPAPGAADSYQGGGYQTTL